MKNGIKKEEFVRLVQENKNGMYRLALGMLKNESDAEDAVAEAVLKAYENISKLRKPEKFKSWIMQILVNVSKTMLVKRKKIQFTDDMMQWEGSYEDKNRDLWEIVYGLDKEFRTIVILYYYEGFKSKEIAKLLHIPEGTVKSRLSRAREKLRTIVLKSES